MMWGEMEVQRSKSGMERSGKHHSLKERGNGNGNGKDGGDAIQIAFVREM